MTADPEADRGRDGWMDWMDGLRGRGLEQDGMD